MKIELNAEEIDMLLSSLDDAKQRVQDAAEMLQAVRRERLEQIADLSTKLREAKEKKKETDD